MPLSISAPYAPALSISTAPATYLPPSPLKSYSRDFEMIFQIYQFGDVLQMDLHHRTLAKLPALWFCDTPLFSPTHLDTNENLHNFLKKQSQRFETSQLFAEVMLKLVLLFEANLHP